jgi:putative redox protein
MEMEANASWQGGLAFLTTTGSGHLTLMDGDPGAGGQNQGAAPKEMLLAALAACTAMDVAAILQHMHEPLKDLSVRASGDVAPHHPRVFERIRLEYELTGDVAPERFARAVELSQHRYCPISAMLRASTTISAALILNGVPLADLLPQAS